MTQKILFFILASIASILFGFNIVEAQVQIPGGDIIQQSSIRGDGLVQDLGTDGITNVGLKLLGVAKVIISGFALIYLVLIGVYMVVNSDDEGELTKQKKQILYALIGFIFLNIPGSIYLLFLDGNSSGKTIGSNTNWTEVTDQSAFWNTIGIQGFLGDLIDFLKVIAFIAAVVMFTWGAFSLILSRGKDEYKETAQNRLVYGIMGLLFLGMVEAWAKISTGLNINVELSGIAKSVFGLAFYFAAPAAVFFLILGAYYYITSAGDEDRAKKGKNIVINTFIAAFILFASISFLNELSGLF